MENQIYLGARSVSETNERVQVFTNEVFGKVRVIIINDEPWFVGKDVAKALGYTRPTKAVQDHVDIDDRDAVPIQDSIGRKQKTPIINESGLYSLILSSKLPSAKKFKHWVTSKILPSVRKHGTYITDAVLDEILGSPEFAYQLMAELQEEKRITDVLTKGIMELEPKASYCESVLQCQKAVPISIIAKDYGMTAVQFNILLNELKIQYKVGGTWILHQNYANKGYTKTKTFLNEGEYTVHTYWTQKGRLFLYEFLKMQNIFPLKENVFIYTTLDD